MKTLIILLLSPLTFASQSYTESDSLPSGYQSWTEYRIERLNQFSSSLLDRDNSKNEVVKRYPFLAEAPELSNKLTIKVSNYNSGCFYEDGLLDYDLYWKDHVKTLSKQIRYIYEFTRKYYLSTSALNLNLFAINNVEICSKRSSRQKEQLSYKNGTLTVYLEKKTFSPFGGFKTLLPSEIEQLWSKGVHLENDLLKKLWPILNPTGEFRFSIRELLLKKGLHFYARNEVQPNKALMDVSFYSTLSNAFLEKGIESIALRTNLELTQGDAWVNVGNFHRIHIGSTSTFNSLNEVIEETPVNTLNINQNGRIVNVYTIDDIQINFPFNLNLNNRNFENLMNEYTEDYLE